MSQIRLSTISQSTISRTLSPTCLENDEVPIPIMTVRCTAIKDSRGKESTHSPWLTLGRLYTVLSVRIEANGIITFQILPDNNNGPGIFKNKLFEVTDGNIPTNWKIDECNGVLRMSPTAWKQSGFWEKFFDADPEAQDVFRRELDIIQAPVVEGV